MIVHAVPLMDAITHTTDDGLNCRCCPHVQIQEDGTYVIMHRKYHDIRGDEEPHEYHNALGRDWRISLQ